MQYARNALLTRVVSARESKHARPTMARTIHQSKSFNLLCN
jgi:hypothetical protein